MNHRRQATSEKRILTVLRWPVGGIRTYLLYNYPFLAEAGYRFTLVGPAEVAFRAMSDELRCWKGVEFVEVPVRQQRCALRQTVRRLLGQHRFCLIHSQGLIAAAAVVLANLDHGAPHVVTSHDVLRADQFHGLGGRLRLHALDWLLSRADALVAVSHDARDNHGQFLPRLRRSGKMRTIINGIDTSRFRLADETSRGDLRAQWGIPADRCLLGFLGRFMEQKGFLVLVEALDRLLRDEPTSPVHLLTVASGDFIREYRAEIHRRPSLSPRVTLLDHTADIAPILQELDLLVMPSLWEACPLLPMEAMSAGVPVLGSDCIGLREVLADTPSRMAKAGDADQWARAIHEAAASPWTAAARQFAPAARQRFDVQRSARELLALFDSMTRMGGI